MIRLARFLRRLRRPAMTRIILGDDARQRGYRLPFLIPEFQCLVVQPNRDEFGVLYGVPDDWSDPPRGRQHQFGGHPDVPFTGLAQ